MSINFVESYRLPVDLLPLLLYLFVVTSLLFLELGDTLKNETDCLQFLYPDHYFQIQQFWQPGTGYTVYRPRDQRVHLEQRDEGTAVVTH
jgi:hypothetical protein